jgi:hypothetical protein
MQLRHRKCAEYCTVLISITVLLLLLYSNESLLSDGTKSLLVDQDDCQVLLKVRYNRHTTFDAVVTYSREITIMS